MPFYLQVSSSYLHEFQKGETILKNKLKIRGTLDFDLTFSAPLRDCDIQFLINITAGQVFHTSTILPTINEAVSMVHFQGGRYDTIFSPTPTPYRLDDSARYTKEHRELVVACKRGESPVLHFSSLTYSPTDPSIGEMISEHFLNPMGLSKWLNCRITTTNPGMQRGLNNLGFSDALGGVLGISYLNRQINPNSKNEY